MHATLKSTWSLRITLCLVTVIVLAIASKPSRAQTLIGSSGAGWQTWNLAVDDNSTFIDLNSNGFPYWDVPLLTFGNYNIDKSPANKSIGWCLTSTGDCQGMGSALL